MSISFKSASAGISFLDGYSQAQGNISSPQAITHGLNTSTTLNYFDGHGDSADAVVSGNGDIKLKSGLYVLTGQLTWAASTVGVRQIYISNGQVSFYSPPVPATELVSNNLNLSLLFVMSINNANVQVRAIQDSGASLNINSGSIYVTRLL